MDNSTTRTAHWEHVWTAKDEEQASWYQADPRLSLELITRFGLAHHEDERLCVLDVGGGASRVVDGLLARGLRCVGVLDVAAPALDLAQRRLGERAGNVEWIVADVTRYAPEHRWDVWHDRAVFHFLTDPKEQQAYARVAASAVPSGGHAVLATFGPEGPTRCSGLDVARHSSKSLADVFSEHFDLVASREELHRTPGGSRQPFVYVVLRRR